jgi:hypothetical protein
MDIFKKIISSIPKTYIISPTPSILFVQSSSSISSPLLFTSPSFPNSSTSSSAIPNPSSSFFSIPNPSSSSFSIPNPYLFSSHQNGSPILLHSSSFSSHSTSVESVSNNSICSYCKNIISSNTSEIICEGGHHCCNNCFEAAVKMAVKFKTSVVPCIVNNCKYYYSEETIKNNIPFSLLKELSIFSSSSSSLQIIEKGFLFIM